MIKINPFLGSQKNHIITDLEEWPITKFYTKRTEFIKALNEYTFSRLQEKNVDLISVLEKTIYMEKQRVKNKPWKVDPPDDEEYWSSLGKDLAGAISLENREQIAKEMVIRIINRYAEEIVGGFLPKTFRFARNALTAIFKRLFNRIRFPYLFKAWGPKSELFNKIQVSGSIDEVRSIFEMGTVILVPNHFSNLDSILLGYAIDAKVGIPAFTWGAGLNLFDYEILARYMNRLGTYRVDRRKKNPIYLETLKAMSSLSQHFGLNNIFFPGGTRSRSGAMEKNLKLGLLQSTLEAQRLNLQHKTGKKIYIVPVVLGYHFVLEANRLIEGHLRQAGREKYTRIGSGTSKLKKTWVVFKNILRNETDVSIHFCKPIDVVGNNVDINGDSFDQTGKKVDIKDYFTLDDLVNKDNQREKVYTQILATKILDSYYKENIILSSHLLAFVAFRLAYQQFDGISVYEMMNRLNKKFKIDAGLLHKELSQVIAKLILKEEAGEVMLSDTVRSGATETIKEGIYKLGLFHQKKPLFRKNVNSFSSESFKLLYYYHNRLNGFGIEKYLDASANLVE